MKGIKLNNKKEMSFANEVIDFSSPSRVYVPLINGNTLCKCIVKEGKKVKKGTIVGKRVDINFPILSPVSGLVVGVKKVLYSTGIEVDAVEIVNDKKESLLRKSIVNDITKYTKDEFVELLRKCSITGMGGADFPTFLKYKNEVNTLIVNAVECEPYLTSDEMLCKLKADVILETIDAIMKINNIEKSYIAYNEVNNIIKNAFSPYMENYPNIILRPVKNIYPAGWGKYLVKEILNVTFDKHSTEIGVVVNNVSTIFAIYKVLKYKRGITKRIVTISGEGFTDPVNILVKNGTDMSTVIKKIGEYRGEHLKLIAGGPMMGTALPSDNVIATNRLSGITIISDTIDEINECMGCARCIKVCPANLCPALILKNIDNVEKLKKLQVEKCMECGLCSYVCPSKIGLRDIVIHAKNEVRK